MTQVLSLHHLPPVRVAVVWPSLLHDLRLNTEAWTKFTTEEDIYSSLLGGQYQLWVLLDKTESVEFVFITAIVHYALGNSLQLIWAHGRNPKTIVLSIEALEQAARQLGCVRLEIVVHRKGWGRLLEPHGYKPFYQVVMRELSNPTKGEVH